MNTVHVKGKERGEIFLYTLSTCGWCKSLKKWLDKKGLSYSYVDVDLEPAEKKQAVMEEVRRWNPRCSFPTIVLNGKDCRVGFKPEKLEEMLR